MSGDRTGYRFEYLSGPRVVVPLIDADVDEHDVGSVPTWVTEAAARLTEAVRAGNPHVQIRSTTPEEADYPAVLVRWES